MSPAPTTGSARNPRNRAASKTRLNPLTREANAHQHAKTPPWGLRDHP